MSDQPHTEPRAGSDAGSDAEPHRAADLDPLDLRPLDPRVRALWWTVGALMVVPPTILVVLVGLFVDLPGGTALVAGGVAVAIALAAALVPAIRYKRWGYALRERDLVIRYGVFWVTVSIIPYARLQFVDTRQGPLDRLFGLSQLVVHTAALGVSGRLPGLDTERAEELREHLAAVETDAVSV